MTSGVETAATRAITKALAWSWKKTRRARLLAELEQQPPLLPVLVADRTFDRLSPEQVAAVAAYLASPDYEMVALQLVISRHRGEDHVEFYTEMYHEIRESLRHRAVFAPEQLRVAADAVQTALEIAYQSQLHDPDDQPGPRLAGVTAHGVTLAARNGRLLARIESLAEIHDQASRLRSQVAASHRELRLSHTGTTRAVAWDDLYILPELLAERPQDPDPPTLEEIAHPGSRVVILGDPGAGKSTLAAKLACDLASDVNSEVVPFHVVLRDLTEALRAGGKSLTEHLAAVARAPYNVEMSIEAVEYLLLNGRAVVILDGLDELTDMAVRHQITKLVDSFAVLYPLTPVIGTSRRVGYHEAAFDSHRFRLCLIAPFNQERVETYVHKWFSLNGSLRPAEQQRLAASLLRESASIHDLRSNPLLLSLLCAMYATEQFLPRNRAQIYERCAVMVFDRWDSMRGIRLPVEFEGKLRGAIQELAWHLFTRDGAPELALGRIQRLLVDYLCARHFEEHDARAMAKEFLEFCAGRAWVLAEVGATDTEPIYGFAHRTFLEYFTAEHLVRRHSTPELLWEQLKPRVGAPQWHVVAQLAVQLLDRNVDEGAEQLIRLALADEVGTETAIFAAQLSGQVGLSPELIGRLVDIAWAEFSRWPLPDRVMFWFSDEEFEKSVADSAMHALMFNSLRGNLRFVQRSLMGLLAERVSEQDELAIYLVLSTPRFDSREDEGVSAEWRTILDELGGRFPDRIAAWNQRWPLHVVQACAENEGLIPELADRLGAAPFYSCDSLMGSIYFPLASTALITHESVGPEPAFPAAAATLREVLLHRPLPWLPAERWHPEFHQLAEAGTHWLLVALLDAAWPSRGEAFASFVILSLPYLETLGRRVGAFSGVAAPARALAYLRGSGGSSEEQVLSIITDLRDREVPEPCVRFLVRWVRGEISVVG